MMRRRAIVIESSDDTLDTLTIKAFNILSRAKTVVIKNNYSNEILAIINKNAKVIYALEDSTSLIVDSTEREVVIVTSAEAYGLSELHALRQLNWTIEIVPSVKPYLFESGINKVPVTRRGLNLGFIVVKEKISYISLFDHLKMAIETNATLVLINNFSFLSSIVSALKLTEKADLPVAVVYKKNRKTMWITGTIETITDLIFTQNVPENSVIYLGETLRQYKKVRHELESQVFQDKF